MLAQARRSSIDFSASTAPAISGASAARADLLADRVDLRLVDAAAEHLGGLGQHHGRAHAEQRADRVVHALDLPERLEALDDDAFGDGLAVDQHAVAVADQGAIGAQRGREGG